MKITRPIRVRFVTTEGFMLRDGRCFWHLFQWTYVPALSDFEKLLAMYYDMMTDTSLKMDTKLKRKKPIIKTKQLVEINMPKIEEITPCIYKLL